MLSELTVKFRRVDVFLVEAIRAHGTVDPDHTDGRQTYCLHRRNLQFFSFVVVDAVWARGTVSYDRTDGRQSYWNLRTSKIYVQLSRALMHQPYLENG